MVSISETNFKQMPLKFLFNHQTNSVSGAAGILAISALASRLLGVARDWLLAKTFGAGPELDVYLAAFRIPDFIYNILIAGGIVVAFLPLFSEFFSENKEYGWKFASNVLNIFLFFLILFSLVLFIFAPSLIKLITPGFNAEQLAQTILLTRLMFLSPILLGLSSIFSGILQYFNRFLVYGLCPILYNLGIIFGIVFMVPLFGISGVAAGVILGAFFHFIIQVPSAIACGFKFRSVFSFWDPGIKRLFLLILPRTFGIAAQQVNLVIVTAIASTLAVGSITVFNFANNVQSLPLSIIGVSFALAIFPSLAKSWAESKKEEFVKIFSQTFRQILYLIVPISFLMFLLAGPITEIIFLHGEFTQDSVDLTAATMGLFCLSIAVLSLIPLLFRAFFAFQDTKTPTLITILTVLMNIFLSFYLTGLLKYENPFQQFLKNAFSLQNISDISVLGLSLACSATFAFQAFLLMVFLYRKIGDFHLKEILKSFLKILFSGVVMALAVLLAVKFVSGAIFQILVAVLVGAPIYLVLTHFFKSPEIGILKSSILKKITLTDEQ